MTVAVQMDNSRPSPAGYPAGGGCLAGGGSSGDVAASLAAATLAAVPRKTNYVAGIQFTYTGSTSIGTFLATLTGVQGGTRTWVLVSVAGVTLSNPALVVAFEPPLQATGPNTAITFSATCPSGNLHSCANMDGFTV